MAVFNYTSFKNWGMDSMCVQDYNGYLSQFEKEINPEMTIATFIMMPDDHLASPQEFINIADKAGAELIVIELCNIEDREEYEFYWNNLAACLKFTKHYVDLQSYETKLSFGRKMEN